VRINPYHLSENLLAQLVARWRLGSWVSVWGSPVRRKLMRSARHWLDPTLLTA
jgi:hypothetical protein